MLLQSHGGFRPPLQTIDNRLFALDASSGEVLGDWLPWQGTAADLFVQTQFPMHSGRILGLPGRILISVMGLVVAMLSVTGIVIWWRKRRARRITASRSALSSAARPGGSAASGELG